jgi:hypothetical protein
MNQNSKVRIVMATVRRHPVGTAAIGIPVLVAASVLTGTTMASAGPEATLAVPAAALHAAPAQHVMIFDNHLPKTGAVVKLSPTKITWHETGCDADYGTPNQCVPWTIPGSTGAARCAWLKSMGFGPLKVAGTNRQDLPENAAGYVCASDT